MNHLKKLFASLGFSAFLLAAISFYISYRLLHPPRRKQEKTPKNFGLKYKSVEFNSKDKTLLKGWLIQHKNPKGLIVLSHGYSWDKQSLLPAAKELYKNNYSSILFDYRAHGESEGHKTTIGFTEQEDLIAAVDFAKRFSNKIGIFGISMGAAAAIMATPKITGLTAIVVDSCFADLKEIIYKKSFVLRNLIIQFMELQGVDFNRAKPISAVSKITVPVFFIHGEKDSIVPFKDSTDLYKKANKPKKIWIVKGGQHGRSYFVNREKYLRNVVNFLDIYFL